jgi:16S rRNA (guanine966-N2)-methyltransferase
VRIIAGIYGGRRLETPKSDDIRPTSDKLRGAIFNALASRIDFDGITVLDICCGTGALGLEALSRGAGKAVFIDSARGSLDLARKNAAALGAHGIFLLKDAAKLGDRPEDIAPAALFFCDPPYNKHIIPGTLQALASGGWLEPGAFSVLEMDKKESLALPSGFSADQEKIYGDTKVIYAYFQP